VDFHHQFEALFAKPEPVLALAPMQEVTDLPFWKLMAAYGGRTFNVTGNISASTATVHPARNISKSVTEKPDGPADHRPDDRQRYSVARAHGARVGSNIRLRRWT